MSSTAEDFGLASVRINDEGGTAEAVALSANRSVVSDVVFDSCNVALKATAGDEIRVADCRVVTHRTTTYVIHFDGTHNRCVVSGNIGKAPASTSAFVRLDDGVRRGSHLRKRRCFAV